MHGETFDLTWMESMSTEKTLAPSLESSAANGLPTTSDLGRPQKEVWVGLSISLPVNNGYSLSIGSITVREKCIVDPNIFQAFHNR